MSAISDAGALREEVLREIDRRWPLVVNGK
jgi:hypothetical protein